MLKDLIKEDIHWNCTPDIAKLRYLNDDVFVFLWDDMQESEALSAFCTGLVPKVDYYLVSANAVTKEKYQPWYELKGSSFNAYCVEDTMDLMYLKDDYKHLIGGLKSIRGKLYKVTLDTLLHLDWFYENNNSFNRTVIEVYDTAFSSKPRESGVVFTYMNSIDEVADWDSEQMKFTPKKEFDFTDLNVVTVNNKEVYSF